ncbi:MAG: periplasmic heavy metal sensor [Thermoanaerobaculia bacterium]
MRRNWLVLALLLSLGINVGLVGVAWLRHRGWSERFAGVRAIDRDPGVRLAERLGLEGEPRGRFLAIQRRLGVKLRELRPQLVTLEREVRQELAGAAPDRERIDALQRRIAEMNLELDRALAESVLASREVLSGRAERRYLFFIQQFPMRSEAERPPRDPRGPRPPEERRERGESRLGPPPGKP